MGVSAQAQSDCGAIMRALMARGQSQTQVEPGLLRLKNYAQGLELSGEVVSELDQQWVQGLSEISNESAENWLLYVKTLAPKKQLEAMQMMGQMRANDSAEAIIKRFQKIEKKIAHKEKSYYSRALKKIEKANPELAPEEMSQLAQRQTSHYMDSYRRLSFECRSKTWNPTRKKAAATFKKFTIGIGIASSFGSMAYANRDRELEDWIGQFGYETVMGIITGNIASRILSNPTDTELAKAIKKYFFSRGTGLVDMGLYGMFFGADESEAQARLDEVLSDPERAERLRELQHVFEEKQLYQRVRASLVEALVSLKETIGLEQAPPIDLGVDWGALTEEDLAREDVQDVLLAAAISELYAEGRGNLITSGDVGSDRYLFHAAYGAIMMPKDMLTTAWIYNILCLGMGQPKLALLKATGVYVLNRIVFDQLYYAVRRSAINQ